MRHHLKLYFLLLVAQARSQAAYPLSLALDIVSTTLITFTEVLALALVLPRFGQLAGWSIGEVALLYGLAELGFVLMDLLFGGFDAPNLSGHVRSGSFNTFLLRPVPLILQVFGSDFAVRRLGRVLLASGILWYGLHAVALSWNPETVWLLISCILGLIGFFGALFVIGGTLTFWTVESVEAMNVLTYGGRTLITYPLEIYEHWLRRIFTFVLPAAFLTYFPALHLLGRPLPDGIPEWVVFLPPLVGGVMLLLAFGFWRVGLRFYQGTGT